MYHIFDEDREISMPDYRYPTLCGQYTDVGEVVTGELFYEIMGKESCCPNCACHPDFSMILLAYAGDE